MLEMLNEVKVTDEEILAMWEKTTTSKRKAQSLLVEAQMFAAKAEYYRTKFWEAVGEKYNINMSSVTWKYDPETQTVSRHEEDEGHPLAKLLSGLKSPSSGSVSLGKDNSGTVI